MNSIEELYKRYLQNPSICTDTRQLEKGDLFFALKGESFNGNDYATQAIQKGAFLAIVDEEKVVESDRFFLVPDVLECLQQLASYHREQLNIPVLAISGSNGKTTTKELIAGILENHYKTHYTKGNFNNHIGVPLTLLSMTTDTEIAVIEMGANHLGEIQALCAIAKPTHGLLTNVGQAHLEGFGSFEGVKKAKSELYGYLSENDGIVFVNIDEPFLLDLAAPVKRKIRYSTKNAEQGDQNLNLECISIDPIVKVSMVNEDGQKYEVITHLSGKHNLQNIITAISVSDYFKVPISKITGFLENYQSNNNRSQWLEKQEVSFLMDAYNANPSSMKASLDSFNQQEAERKLAILGDMFELGTSSAKHHLATAAYALELGLENIYLVGKHFGEAAQRLGLPHFETVIDLKKKFDFKYWKNSKVLIKGSRGMALERLLTED